MKHTEEQIKEKARQIMKDLNGKYYFENCVVDTFFKKKEDVFTGKSKGKVLPIWIVGIKAIADNENLLLISDETGEPLYYQNFSMVCFDVEKDKYGKYFKTEID